MRPENTRVWRKTRRQEDRGRHRGTRPVTVTYGHRLRERDRLAFWAGDLAAGERLLTTPAGTQLRAP